MVIVENQSNLRLNLPLVHAAHGRKMELRNNLEDRYSRYAKYYTSSYFFILILTDGLQMDSKLSRDMLGKVHDNSNEVTLLKLLWVVH